MRDSESVLAAIGHCGILPVILELDVAQAEPMAAALKSGGLPCVEVTLRTASAERALRAMSADRDMLVGAGTVLTCAQVDRAVEAGARFIVSPGLDEEVVGHCIRVGVQVIPGVATPSEIQKALAMGLELVKFFPAEPLGGIKMLSALAAPFPGLRFVPTGGIGPDLVRSYLEHNAVHAVGGSWIVTPAIIAGGRWGEVARLAAQAVAARRAVRAEVS